MSMQDLYQAFDIIEKCDFTKSFNGKKSLDLIETAEKFLELKFPPTYRKFLENYGCRGPESVDIFGIVHENFKNSGMPDAIWLTMVEREAGAPSDIIFIASTGYGPYYVLDCSRPDQHGEYPVLIWAGDDFNRHKMEIVNEDFGAFLLQELQNMDEVKAQERLGY